MIPYLSARRPPEHSATLPPTVAVVWLPGSGGKSRPSAAAAIVLKAHKELERLTGTIHQNQFKPGMDQKWAYLVYAGLWWEPLREDLEAYIDHVNRQVTGTIGLRLFKGGVRVVTRESPNAVYDAQLATFSESGGLFSQHASPGFIELWSLQSALAYRLHHQDPETP